MFEVTVKDRQKLRVAREVAHLTVLGKYVVEELKYAIDRTTLDNKGEIKRSIGYKVHPDKVVVYSEHDAFYLDMGVEPHQMRYVGSRVVPFDLREVRNPTAKDKKQGVAFRVIHNTQHPGTKPLKFVEKAVEKAEERFAAYLLTEVF